MFIEANPLANELEENDVKVEPISRLYLKEVEDVRFPRRQRNVREAILA